MLRVDLCTFLRSVLGLDPLKWYQGRMWYGSPLGGRHQGGGPAEILGGPLPQAGNIPLHGPANNFSIHLFASQKKITAPVQHVQQVDNLMWGTSRRNVSESNDVGKVYGNCRVEHWLNVLLLFQLIGDTPGQHAVEELVGAFSLGIQQFSFLRHLEMSVLMVILSGAWVLISASNLSRASDAGSDSVRGARVRVCVCVCVSV